MLSATISEGSPTVPSRTLAAAAGVALALAAGCTTFAAREPGAARSRPPAAGEEGSAVELRVVTFNILKLEARPGAERIAPEIAAEAFDVLAMQESASGYFGRGHNHRLVARALASAPAAAAAPVAGELSGRWAATSGLAGVFRDGLSTFARGPAARLVFADKRRLSWYLTRRGRFLERRFVQYALLELGAASRRVGLLNAHLTNRDGGERIREVERMLAYADRMRADPRHGAELQILVGDLNSTPGEREQELIAAAGFADVWALARPGEDGFTWDDRPDGNTEAQDPTEPGEPDPGRIDYVYIRPYDPAPGAANRWTIDSAEIVLDQKVETPAGRFNLSDHYGVAARLTVR